MQIGNRIQEYREKHGLSQEMLAEKLGVSRQSVSKWELNQAMPEIDKVVAMSKLFEITTDKLLIEPTKLELKIIQPKTYEDVYNILEMLQKNIIVIINFEETDEEVKKQIMNKITDDIEVTGGQIQQVSPNSKSFICSSDPKYSFEKLKK